RPQGKPGPGSLGYPGVQRKTVNEQWHERTYSRRVCELTNFKGPDKGYLTRCRSDQSNQELAGFVASAKALLVQPCFCLGKTELPLSVVRDPLASPFLHQFREIPSKGLLGLLNAERDLTRGLFHIWEGWDGGRVVWDRLHGNSIPRAIQLL